MVFLTSPLVAFGGGLANFFGSCLLPLVPLYLGYLSIQPTLEKKTLWPRIILFLLGFLAIFFLLGFAAQGTLGFVQHRRLVEILAGCTLVLVAGVSVIPIRLAARSKTQTISAAGLLVGVLLGIVWTPCIGPIFATVLYMASNKSTQLEGGIVLLAYGLGLLLPFLIIGLLWQRFLPILQGHTRQLLFLQRLSLAVVVCFALLLIFGYYNQLAGLLIAHFPQLG